MKSSGDRASVSENIRCLNELSDIDEVYKVAKAQNTGEVKRMLAWWDGRALQLANSMDELCGLPPRRQVKRSLSTKGVSQELVFLPNEPQAAMWCVAINEGDGFSVLGKKDGHEWELREALLNVVDRPSENAFPTPPLVPVKSDILNWLEAQRNDLVSACHQIASIDQRFDTLWQEHEQTIGDGNNWPSEGFGWPSGVVFPHTLQVAIDAFQALHRLHFFLVVRVREVRSPKGDQLLLSKPHGLNTFLLRIASEAHNAGLRAKALQALTSSHRTLSTLGAAKNVQRLMGRRAKFILREDRHLTEQLGKPPSTLALMHHLDGQTDPETSQKIMRRKDDDGTWIIQWSDDNTQTHKQFAVKVSELRRKSKIVH